MMEKLIECLRFCAEDDSDCMNCRRWNYDCGSSKCVNDLLLKAAFALEEKQATSNENKQWIPVTERLPEKGKIVLVCGSRGGIYTAFYKGSRYWHKLNSKSHFCEPTHWMPLPEPPKEKADGI